MQRLRSSGGHSPALLLSKGLKPVTFLFPLTPILFAYFWGEGGGAGIKPRALLMLGECAISVFCFWLSGGRQWLNRGLCTR